MGGFLLSIFRIQNVSFRCRNNMLCNGLHSCEALQYDRRLIHLNTQNTQNTIKNLRKPRGPTDQRQRNVQCTITQSTIIQLYGEL